MQGSHRPAGYSGLFHMIVVSVFPRAARKSKHQCTHIRKWQPTPVFLPGEFHRQRSLAGYSPWSHKESDMTEQLTHTYTMHMHFSSLLGLKPHVFLFHWPKQVTCLDPEQICWELPKGMDSRWEIFIIFIIYLNIRTGIW